MSDRAIDANFQALVIDDGQQVRDSRVVREQLLEQYQGTSPTRRTAASPPDLDLVGRSQALLEVMKQVERVAPTDAPVLLIGEAGSGEELVAAAIHQRSRRADKPFVVVKCGADHDGSGLWETDGATVFLEGLTETTPTFQANLLRALQMNVRVIAATDGHLDQEVIAGRFRNDLFQRLSAVSIVLPPLREDLSTRVRNYAQVSVTTNGHSSAATLNDLVPFSTIEGRYVAQVLEYTRGNKQAAARVLVVDRKTLDRMIKRHHIDSEKLRRAYR
jgi:transcriptional regulator with GAF, ATPase, and Fis domain